VSGRGGLLTWPELLLALVVIYWRWLVGGAVAVAALLMILHHVGRDNHLKTELAGVRLELQLEKQACSDVRDLAQAIEQTPTGSRTEAGRILARR
jgi:hypothetical protein